MPKVSENIVTMFTKNGNVLEYIETPKSHYYKLNGNNVVGISTLSKCHPMAHNLLGWYMSQASNYALATVTAHPEKKKEEIVKESKTAFEGDLKIAADIGTIVHEHAFLSETKQFDKLDELAVRINLHPHKDKINNGIMAFTEWELDNKDEIMMSEEVVASVKYQFAGRFDTLRRRKNGKVVLSDYKTSKGFYPEQFIQLAAYKIGLKEWHGIDVDYIEILRFGKDGEFKSKLIDDPQKIERFETQAIRCRETYEFIKFTNKEFKY